MKDFIKKHLKKGFQFGVVGSIGAVINLTVQYVLVKFLQAYFVWAAIVGIFAAVFSNYFLNYYWTFRGIE